MTKCPNLNESNLMCHQGAGLNDSTRHEIATFQECLHCTDQINSLHHFLFTCSKYANLREKYISATQWSSRLPIQLPSLIPNIIVTISPFSLYWYILPNFLLFLLALFSWKTLFRYHIHFDCKCIFIIFTKKNHETPLENIIFKI